MIRLLLLAALLVPAIAPAQTTTVIGVPPSLQVSRLAPQLVAFAGSQANFENLVNGLALGAPVSLVTTLPNGQVQTVSFTPQGAMTATQIAQTLETVRQGLISRGIATPTGEQLSSALTSQPVAVVQPVTVSITAPNPNGTPSPAALIQGQSGAGGTTPPSPAQIIQNQRGSNISDTPSVGNISNTPSTTAPAATAPAANTPAAPFAPPATGAPAARPFAAPAR